MTEKVDCYVCGKKTRIKYFFHIKGKEEPVCTSCFLEGEPVQ